MRGAADAIHDAALHCFRPAGAVIGPRATLSLHRYSRRDRAIGVIGFSVAVDSVDELGPGDEPSRGIELLLCPVGLSIDVWGFEPAVAHHLGDDAGELAVAI